jgi:hypothetical protein
LVVAAAVALREVLAGFEAGELSGADCAVLADELAVTEKACVTVRLLAARRGVEAGAHQQRGFKDGASWVARQSGTTASQAGQDLETAFRLADCPDTKNALLAGEISLAQAHEIIKAESERAGAETHLLPLARRSDLSQVSDHAREHRQAHTDAGELRRRQYACRQFRHWRDGEGLVRFAGALPPETGLPLVRRVELAAIRKRRAARVAGETATASIVTPPTL